MRGPQLDYRTPTGPPRARPPARPGPSRLGARRGAPTPRADSAPAASVRTGGRSQHLERSHGRRRAPAGPPVRRPSAGLAPGNPPRFLTVAVHAPCSACSGSPRRSALARILSTVSGRRGCSSVTPAKGPAGRVRQAPDHAIHPLSDRDQAHQVRRAPEQGAAVFGRGAVLMQVAHVGPGHQLAGPAPGRGYTPGRAPGPGRCGRSPRVSSVARVFGWRFVGIIIMSPTS